MPKGFSRLPLMPSLRPLSSRAQRGICFFFFVLVLSTTIASAQPKRPKILRIFDVRISVSDLGAAQEFYSDLTGLDLVCHLCETSRPVAVFPSGQALRIVPGGSAERANRVIEISFAVDNLDALKRLLQANHVTFKDGALKSEVPSVLVQDPEHNALRFVPDMIAVRPKLVGEKNKLPTQSQSLIPKRLIHAGFVVKDRAAMDRFYKDILGFHVYWSGGMKDGATDWVDMQLPDGTDWIEYMLNVPDNADKPTLGIMNHIALGVPDVHAAAKELESTGMKLSEQPQIGRDGKWQLNLYDPDGTRVEFMEFTPVEKPCCSDYTGPHPIP